jgi:hypothetical protein
MRMRGLFSVALSLSSAFRFKADEISVGEILLVLSENRRMAWRRSLLWGIIRSQFLSRSER